MTVKQGLAHRLREAVLAISRQPVQSGGYGSLNVELAVELGQIRPEEIAKGKTREQLNQGHSPEKGQTRSEFIRYSQ